MDFVESRFTFPPVLSNVSTLPLSIREPFFSRRSCDDSSDDRITLDLSQVEATARQSRAKDEDGAQWSEMSLTLQPFHYTNDQLNLRCTAQIPGIYSTMSEQLQLGMGIREPVPERGKYEKSHFYFLSNVL